MNGESPFLADALEPWRRRLLEAWGARDLFGLNQDRFRTPPFVPSLTFGEEPQQPAAPLSAGKAPKPVAPLSAGGADEAMPGMTPDKLSAGAAPGAAAPFEGQLPRRPSLTDPAYQPEKLRTWQKILGAGAAFAAGVGTRNPMVAGQLMEQVLSAPETEAGARYERDVAAYEGQVGDVERRARLAETGARTREITARARGLERPDHPTDKKIDEYTDESGNKVVIFQKANGDLYEKTFGKVQQKPSALTPHTVEAGGRIKQYNYATGRYNIDVGPAPRTLSAGELTPAQKLARQKALNLAESQKNAALSRAETEIRRRYGLTGFQATDAWPPQAAEELEAAKQRIQDEYETKLANLGADVAHYEYGTTQPGAAAPKTLDADTARRILAEAGGDKEKARRLARQRGYQF